jgi:hypothetical protein
VGPFDESLNQSSWILYKEPIVLSNPEIVIVVVELLASAVPDGCTKKALLA